MVVRGLSAGKPLPPEVIDYLLLEHFHCLPSELDREDNARLMQFLTIRTMWKNEEAAYQESQKH